MTAARPVKRRAGDHAYFDGDLSELMESLPGDAARSLIHVFECPSCQDLALAHLADSVESRDEQPADLPSAEVAALADELLGTPGGKWSEVLKDPRFHRMDLLDRLMEDRRFAMESRAALAICLGAQVDPVDPAISSRMMRAYCLEATSHRRAGRLRDAETGLDNAACFLTAEPRDLGCYSRTVALLRWEQGRLHDAAAHLRYGAQAFGEIKLRVEQGVCLALLGLAYLPEAQFGAENLHEFVKAGPSAKTAESMAAVLSTHLRRSFRLRFPGLQTLPWS